LVREVVIGAGAAGCVVAARRLEVSDAEVVVLEAGPDRTPTTRPDALRSLAWLDALADPTARWPDTVAARTPGGGRAPYLRGRGVGGSAAINGMLHLPARPEDHDRWARTVGDDRWAWATAAGHDARVGRGVLRLDDAELAPLDLAVLAAAGELGWPDDVELTGHDDGAGRLPLAARDGRRHASAEAWLDPHRDQPPHQHQHQHRRQPRHRPRLTVRTDTTVDRLDLDGDRVRVHLADGGHLDADRVWACAGALATPTLLHRSGVRRAGLGAGLQDHPSLRLPLRLHDHARRDRPGLPPMGAALRTSTPDGLGPGDALLLPVTGSLDAGVTDAALLIVLQRVRTAGRLHLDDASAAGHVVADLDLLSHPADRRAMHAAVATAADVLATAALADVVAEVVLPDALAAATGRATLPPDHPTLRRLHDPELVDAWIDATLATGRRDLSHAVGSCRPGAAQDPGAAVDPAGRVHGDRRVRVADASVLPDVPAAPTARPTMAVADLLATWADPA
jgi:choline dehydrogenase-like flavoprotein